MNQRTRLAVVAEARTWVGTPFHHAARVKGAGVDCANLLVAVFAATGLIPDLALEHYPQDWHMHRDEPRFMDMLSLYADPVPDGEAQPGDIAMFRYGRHAAHGAIVVGWPVVIHAWRDAGKVVMTEANAGPLGERFVGCWRLKAWAES